MTEEFEYMTLQALLGAYWGLATEEDLRILCFHCGMDFNQVKEQANGKNRRNDRVEVPEAV